jgi:hypothetical protein
MGVASADRTTNTSKLTGFDERYMTGLFSEKRGFN